MNVTEFLSGLYSDLQAQFDSNRRVMSFQEYLELAAAAPRQQSRNAAEYLLDCFEYYGSEVISGPTGDVRRWTLFDAPFDDGRDRLVGQEVVQNAIYRILQNFVRQGRVNKMVLLHGPNGSSKSSVLGCIARALEAYSRTDAGALYCFNWVFPSEKSAPRRLGFGSSAGDDDPRDTYAYLTEDKVDARIPGDLRDNPLLLLPKGERMAFLKASAGEGLEVSDTLAQAELAPRSQQIAERLNASYGGDMKQLLKHVQVERFFISRRYRRGAVTVEPQLHVDAGVRQLTGDRSLSSLPLILQSTTLFEPTGDLVDANRGLIEYNDLLKRPDEAFKYLLSTSEKATVALPNQILHLDLLLMGSSNENHLAEFKSKRDWASFKARMELVRVPYLRSYVTEKAIYDDQFRRELPAKPVAPHATFVAALWAVLTRLRKPAPDNYPKELRGVIAGLTPLQKADLYAYGRTPAGLHIDKARQLRSHLDDLVSERAQELDYEGYVGASPREMKIALLNAAQNDDFPTLSPLAVLTEIQELVGQKGVYAFLHIEPEGQYLDHASFVDVVQNRWLDLANDEVTRAMGLVTREQHDEFFRRYLVQVSHHERGEKLLNPVTGKFDEADQQFMSEMEKHFDVDKDPSDFRRELLGRIGAASQKGPLSPVDYRELFAPLFESLEGSYYEAQRPAIRRIAIDVLALLGEDQAQIKDRDRAQRTLDFLCEEFGYTPASVQETIATLLADRYQE